MIVKIQTNFEDDMAETEYYEVGKITLEELNELVKQQNLYNDNKVECITWRGREWMNGDDVMCIREILEEIGTTINPTADFTIIEPCYSKTEVGKGDL